MAGVYVHDVLPELIKLLGLNKDVTFESGKILITLEAGDFVRVTYETIARKYDNEASDE